MKTKVMNKQSLTILASAILLTACGGGGGGGGGKHPGDQIVDPPEPTAFSVSGTLTLPQQTRVDSDTNDPNEPATSNDTLATAQTLTEAQTVSGFTTKLGTNAEGDRFAGVADKYDVYRVSLVAGQRIQLQVSDWLEDYPEDIDLDLNLYDAAGGSLVASAGVSASEAIDITADGTYYVEVEAFEGASNYVLSFSEVGNARVAERGANRWTTAQNFVEGEALVKFQNAGNFAPRARAAGVTLQNVPSHQNVNSEGINRVVFTAKNTRARSATANNVHPQVRDLIARGFSISPELAAKLATIYEIKALARDHDVQYAEPNFISTTMMTPNDYYYSRQWHYPAINLPGAWELSTGENTVVAVLDTGVYLDHPELRGRLVAGYDFVSGADMSQDGDGIDNSADDPGDGDSILTSSFHGTHVAGTIAALTNNGTDVAGVAFNSKIMPVRVLGKGGGTLYDIIQGMRFAAGLSNDSGSVPARKADVINMSLGGYGFSQAYQDAVTQVRQQGVIIVAAAGNEETSNPSMPASLDGVVSVSAVGQDNERAIYSNFGSTIDVAAPGGDRSRDEGVLSLGVKDNGSGVRDPALKFSQGTSMATPHMAGVVALMRSVAPSMTPQQFDDLLRSGRITNDFGATGRDDVYGHGLIDALKAVQAASDLAGGSLPDTVSVSPSTHDFGANSQTTVTVSGQGNGLRVTDVSSDATWLKVAAGNVNNAGLGTYNLQVDRTGLKAARYAAQVTFTVSSGNPVILPIYMSVGGTTGSGSDTIGTAYVLLLDVETEEPINTVMTTAQNGQYGFSLTGVPAGTYVLAAGTDHDNDGLICDRGEGCGLYPLLGSPQTIQVSGNLTGQDFMLVPDGTLVTPSAAEIGGKKEHGFRRK